MNTGAGIVCTRAGLPNSCYSSEPSAVRTICPANDNSDYTNPRRMPSTAELQFAAGGVKTMTRLHLNWRLDYTHSYGFSCLLHKACSRNVFQQIITADQVPEPKLT